ncbi:MAG: inositol monophosphatase [Cyanobacteria bacterium K_DeepCast_35m_m2_155]|nr:inositol monophosphatase [Cyanobacteria bacterium K_DeepCast_35m_m2_155]
MTQPPTPSGAGQALSSDAARASGLSDAELAELVAIARRAALAGGGQLKEHFGRLQSISEKGRAGDLVTNADTAAEAAVLALLTLESPGVAVLAEETGHTPGSGMQQDLQWCVDPLDGTTNYAHGFPLFGTSVGLLWRGTPLLGAIAVPRLDELFWAAPGQGAWCNEQPLHVSSCSQLGDALLVTGFAYDRTTRLDNNYAEFAWFTHRTHGVRRGGAAAVDLAYVAAGRLDGYWERGLSPWDLAAGVVLVEQAGGVVCAYDGSRFELGSGRLIAATPELQHQLIDGLAACQPLIGSSYGAPELDSPSP